MENFYRKKDVGVAGELLTKRKKALVLHQEIFGMEERTARFLSG